METPEKAAFRPAMSAGEWLRKACHAAAFVPALFVPLMTPGQAMAIAASLVVMNAFVLPRVLPGLYRAGSPGHGALEIILYPVAVLAALAAYAHPALPASPAEGKPGWYLVPILAWALLALCDACAGIGYRLFRKGPALPWNRRKTWAGLAFAVVAGWAALALLFRAAAATGWIGLSGLPLDGPRGWVFLGLLAVAAGAALVESLWFGITDNLTLPFAACAVFPLLPTPLLPAGGIPDVTWPLVAAPAAFGVLANLLGMLTLAGALLGTLMAFLLMAADPWLFSFLCGFFALAVGATKWRYQGKAAKRIAEDRGGKRGAAQVFGAMGVAAWMTPLAHLAEAGGDPEGVRTALLVCAAPFVAKVMDTVSSEMGKAIGGPTFTLRRFRRVAPGTEGGVSLAGTLWGLFAAALLAALVVPLEWGDPGTAAALVGIAALANVFESLWGEWALRKGLEDGPHTNFLLTLCSALAAWAVFVRF